MAGNKSGGLKTRDTNFDRYGRDFYKNIGSMGGKIIHNRDPETGKALKGFALNRERASQAGKIGGTRSRRSKVKEIE